MAVGCTCAAKDFNGITQCCHIHVFKSYTYLSISTKIKYTLEKISSFCFKQQANSKFIYLQRKSSYIRIYGNKKIDLLCKQAICDGNKKKRLLHS